MSKWWSLRTGPKELRLDATLFSGQTFLWRETGPNQFTSVLKGHIVTLKQTSDDILVQSDSSEGEVYEILCNYFRLDIKLESLYTHWAERDVNFKKKAMRFEGIDKLCIRYGSIVGDFKTSPTATTTFYSFPRLQALCDDGVEKTLRDLGFGYRAKYISETARKIVDEKGGEEWLMGLRDESYADAKNELLGLSGVGPKVADCILLMSLDKLGAVPVDTHVWKIAKRDYGLAPKNVKTLTPKVYQEIGDVFRSKFGDYAGWAHSVLFKAEITKYPPIGTIGSPAVKPKGKRKEMEATSGDDDDGLIKPEEDTHFNDATEDAKPTLTEEKLKRKVPPTTNLFPKSFRDLPRFKKIAVDYREERLIK
ncbi:8-oxoguanine glycosylase ogg1 [Dinochytrium kinnereticum]|nr:8-oxoguanine glycosylase ogg1 [Dinochytrium kinnereticum]